MDGQAGENGSCGNGGLRLMTGSGKYMVVALVVLGSVCAVTVPAFGEFESSKKETKGSGEVAGVTLEAGGATVTCQNTAESTKGVSWKIENEGKEATKGADISSTIENWGECEIESSELTKTSAKVSECELEIKQPKIEVSGKLGKTCTIAAKSCELKLEAKENESLKYLNLVSSGTENENLLAEPITDNVATTTSGTCPGIKPTKEGKLSGFVELKKVQSTSPPPEFSITAGRQIFRATGETTTITVKNLAGVAQVPTSWSRSVYSADSFVSTGEASCIEKNYAAAGGGANSECSFTVEYKNAAGNALSAWFVRGRNEYPAFTDVHP